MILLLTGLPQGGRLPHRLLAEDFEFSAARYQSLREFSVERDELDMLEKPLAVTRRYVLSRGPAGLQVEFALCLTGPDAAMDLLYERVNAFQRQPTTEAVIDVTAALQIGDVGVAWRWDGREPDGVLAFVRYNVLVFMQGPFEALQEQARELDSDLALRQTSTEYADSGGTLLDMRTEGGAHSVGPGTRFDLGSTTSLGERYFFVASGGSVNRDATNPARYYYRAGLVKGAHTIVIYRLGRGLLPARQTFQIGIL